jgi:hypothetical protein
MNWYWPSREHSTWKMRVALYLFNKILNFVAKVIWFKRTNADLHDKSYAEGWVEADRIRADTWFLRYLLIDCNGVFWKVLIAYLFYFSVRLLWKYFFNYK